MDLKMTNNTELKQKQFIAAMELYEDKRIYKLFGKFISTVNISLQIIIAYVVIPINIGIWWQVFSFIVAYFLTDFINGLVHMYMDNNENYKSVAGPLIASFHLHHKTPLYKKNNLLLVYFNESGSKIWLSGFLIIVSIVMSIFNINRIILYILLIF
ncbi:fatty acid desaturase family protein [Clostridium gasigenes]|uniref:fatty acid desaturase family protein n=1 Tax=Clostridium gasigenes TaxID=94869 RepID=UPI001C0E70C0|nr:fatty acid desaturase family protein [Clostridium gasigenes]MBU3130827.1 fatty acid desaturase family protein [Clostridium gasigenes]